MKAEGNEILTYGKEIILSAGMQSEKEFVQHGNTSCYGHSIHVAQMSVSIVSRLHIRVDMSSLVRGALLHDYFLYDWHVRDRSHRLHGFIHARRALENAQRDFLLNHIERDIISKHMFPLNLRFPRHRESIIVCCADKLCALRETLFPNALIIMAEYGGSKN